MRFLIAWSMIILLGIFYTSCGGTNKASRTVSTGSDSYVNCNQNLWYAYSGCMPPTTWTVPSNFVLPAAWYPSVLGYDYPTWYTEAGLKVSFRSTCNDVGNCNRLTLQESEFYETDPIIRDDANTVYHSFRFDRIISGLGFMGDTSLQWSSSYDKELQGNTFFIHICNRL